MGEEYITEYSTDKIEIHTGAVKPGQRVLLVRSACDLHEIATLRAAELSLGRMWQGVQDKLLWYVSNRYATLKSCMPARGCKYSCGLSALRVIT